MSIDHYENFPVASLLLPARLRPPVEAIYAFARSADDLADEGEALPAERLAALENYELALRAIGSDEARQRPDGLFLRLKQAIDTWRLPMQPFHDLLDAFKQDVVTTRYADFAMLREYCRRSANPVGTLMLHLYELPTAENLSASDAVCTALQLINFLQDVGVDWQKGRIYLPQQDLERFGVGEAQIAAGQIDDNWHALMAFQVQRARELMLSGAPLAVRLPGRIGWELRLVVQGGLRILKRIEMVGYDVFAQRPVLRSGDWIAIGWAALRMGRH